jgi:ATP-dependent DNA helicase RecG
MSNEVIKSVVESELKKGCTNDSVEGGFSDFVIRNIDDHVTKTRANKYKTAFSKYTNLNHKQRTILVNHLLHSISLPVTKPTKSISTNTSNRLRMNDSITDISGIGKMTYIKLTSLGISIIRDALYHIPSRYIDLSTIKRIDELEVGETATVIVEARDISFFKGSKSRITVFFSDKSGQLSATFFNAPWIKNKISIGSTYTISGTVNEFSGLQMVNPDLRLGVHRGRIIPVYPSSKKVKQNLFHNLFEKLISQIPLIGEGSLPRNIIKSHRLMNLEKAFVDVHKPKTVSHAYKARNRLAIEELTLLQTALIKKRTEHKSKPGVSVNKAIVNAKNFITSLPFTPTDAQSRCVVEIANDLNHSSPMNRLLHGDVGSGKTVVGLSGVKASMDDGYQVIWLSPTEVLAKQTFNNARELLKRNTLYLSGSTRKSERIEIQRILHSAEPCLLVGTHALLEEWVETPNLGMVIVDEQHRFGVNQRARLSKKGILPNVLVISATPIPRTLSMTMYGDLDVSVIDEMPSNRLPIRTRVFTYENRSKVYRYAIKEINEGRQAYVVCPLVEKSERLEAKSATETYRELKQSYFADYECALLNGRMHAVEKNNTMEDFKKGKTQVLISTTVIEVGVDVPNVSTMIIENAERFGLAQLHQLRGRVGRGKYQSYCYLIPSRPTKSLSLLESTNDGLEIAEADLKLRGPGDIGGTAQSGLGILDSKLITPSNLSLLPKAREIAEKIIDSDPNLDDKENISIRKTINQRYAKRVGMAWVS